MSSTRNPSGEALRNIPPTTLGVIAVCVSLFVIQNILGWDLSLFTMCPRMVLFTNEYYRVFTSVLFHANLMHIGMNMLSTAAISSALEKRLGTLRLLFQIWYAIFVTGAIYMLIAYIAYAVFGYDKWMYQHAVGFSGIIFYLSVLESLLHPGPRSVFGVFSVPASVYPWVLLLVLQLIMPNLSFLGHLSGILNGTLEYHGVLDVLFVSDSFLADLESRPMMRKLVGLHSYVGATQISGRQRLRAETSISFSFVFQSMRKYFCALSKFVKQSCSRFWTRRSGNDNIESGVIRPPEFYDDNNMYDDEELEPLESRMV